MAKYYVFHYSEAPSKSSGEVYVNIDFIPDNDQERVLSVSVKKSYWQEFDAVKDLDPVSIKKYWFELFTYWNPQYKSRNLNGIRRIGTKQ